MKMVKRLFVALSLGLFALILFACKTDLSKVIGKLNFEQRTITKAGDIKLQEKLDNYLLEWTSNSSTYKVENNTLKVPNLPTADEIIKLTAKITKGKQSAEKFFNITIKAGEVPNPENTFKVVVPEGVKLLTKDIDLTKVKKDTKLTFEVVAPSGKELKELKVNEQVVTPNSENKFDVDVTKDTTITVIFIDTNKYFKVENKKPDNIELVSPSGIDLNNVANNTTLTFKVKTPKDHKIQSLTVNGSNVSVDSDNKFQVKVDKNITIDVEFKIAAKFKVNNKNEGAIELIKPMDVDLNAVLEDTVLTFKVNVPSGQEIAELRVNGKIHEYNESNEFSVKVIKETELEVTFRNIPKYNVQIPSEISVVTPSGLDLTKVDNNTNITFQVNVPSGKTIKSVKVNEENVSIDPANQFRVKITKNTVIKVEFQNESTPTPNGKTVDEGLALKKDTEFDLVEAVVVEKMSDKAVLVANKTYTAYVQVYNEDGFKNINVKDIIKITKTKKEESVKYGTQFKGGTVEKTGVAEVDEPEFLLSKDTYKKEYVNKKFNGQNLKITNIEKGKNKKTGKMEVKYFYLKDHDNNDYKLYIYGRAKESNIIKNAKENDFINLIGVRLDEYQGKINLKLILVKQISKVEQTPEELVNTVHNELALPSEVNHNDTIQLKGKLKEVLITWASDNSAVIDPSTGIVAANVEDTTVKLTATLKYAGVEKTKEFTIKVNARLRTASELAELISEPTYASSDTSASVTQDVVCIASIKNKTVDVNIKWSVENTTAGSFIENIFKPSVILNEDLTTKLIAEVEVDGIKATKEFSITVKANTKTDQERVDEAYAALTLPEEIIYDDELMLKPSLNGVEITWSETTDPKLFSFETKKLENLVISEDKTITLKALLKLKAVEKEKTFTIKFKYVAPVDVEFNLNGGTSSVEIVKQPITPKATSRAIKPTQIPTHNDKGRFKFWSLKNTEDATPFDFENTPITQAITLYAIYDNIDTIATVLSKTNGDYTIKGVIVGVEYKEQKDKTPYVSYLINDGSAIITLLIKNYTEEQKAELNQKVIFRGTRTTTEVGKPAVLRYQNLVLEQTDPTHYIQLLDKNQEVPTITTVEEMTAAYNFDPYKIVKFNLEHKKAFEKNADGSYTLTDKLGNAFTFKIKLAKGQLLTDEKLAEIENILTKIEKLGEYEITALVGPELNNKVVYLYDAKLVKSTKLYSDEEKAQFIVNEVAIKVNTTKNDGEIEVPTTINSLAIEWAEEGTSDLNIDNTTGKITLKNNDIAEDKEVTIKATVKVNDKTATKTFTIKFLKKGTQEQATSTKYDFINNKGNNKEINATQLKALFDTVKVGTDADGITEVTSCDKIYNGGGTGGYGDAEQKWALKMATSKKEGSFTVKLSKKVKKVIVKARPHKKNTNTQLTIGGVEKTISQNFNEYTYEFSTAIDTIKFEAKRANNILSIEFIYE